MAYNRMDPELLKVVSQMDAQTKRPLKVTRKEVDEAIKDKQLIDGVYIIRGTGLPGETYVIARDNVVETQTFAPPDYDVEYLMRMSRLPYIDKLELQFKL